MNSPKPQAAQAEHYDASQDEGRVVEGNLAILQSAEIDRQIATAHQYPRSLTKFRQKVLEQVTLDPVIAGKCLYALPRGKGSDAKVIEGPSIRFAEILYSSWCNNRTGARIVDIGEEFITAQGFFFDLETNQAITFEVMRRIVDKYGKRYNTDMIGVTGNAAASIALRNAVTRGIPQAFWADHLDAARKIVAGDVKTLIERRQNMVKMFTVFGVVPEQIYGLLGVKGIEDLTIENLVVLNGIHTSIKDGETTPEEAFSQDKMQNPGEVTPARPMRSEFTRPEEKATTLVKGLDARKAPERKDEPVTGPGRPTVQYDANPYTGLDEPEAIHLSAQGERAIREAQDHDDFITEAYDDLAKTPLLRDIGKLRDAIVKAGMMSEDEEIEWHNACDVRGKEILAVSKAARGK